MNFLAHLFLSNNCEDIMLGNLLGDFLKDINIKQCSEGVQQGIALHKKIDTFTDEHHVVKKSKERIRGVFSHYAPVVIDIYYDHFLAKNWNHFSEESLEDFAQRCYRILRKNSYTLPLKLWRFITIMRTQDVLTTYRDLKGLDKIFRRMIRRTHFKSNLEFAVEELKKGYPQFEAEFLLFFPDLQTFVKEEIIKIQDNKKV